MPVYVRHDYHLVKSRMLTYYDRPAREAVPHLARHQQGALLRPSCNDHHGQTLLTGGQGRKETSRWLQKKDFYTANDPRLS